MADKNKSKADKTADGNKKDGKAADGTKEPETSVIATVEDLEAQYPQLVAGIIASEKPVIEKVEDLEAQYPELVAEIREKPVIEKAEDLEAQYPQLVAEIRDQVVDQLGKCSIKQVQQNLPDLYARIVTDIQNKSGSNLSVPGFLLEVDDPFAEGTLRTYQKLKGITGQRLPWVLPNKDKFTRPAVENYILRAGGAGDKKRVDAARLAMKKIK